MNANVEKLLRGAAGGLVATVPMSALMLAAREAGLLGKAPPKTITESFLRRLGIHADAPTRHALTIVNHLGFGAACGAAFGVARPQRWRRAKSIVAGALYGVGVWAASYQGWVPALGILPAASRDRRDRQATMLVAHVVFGAALGAFVSRRRADSARREPGADRSGT